MSKRKQQAVIRFRKYNKDTEPSRAKLMLYYPWFDEQADLLGGYPSYEAHYRRVCDTVLTNESKYTKEAIEELDVDEEGPSEHLWNNITPSTEEHRLHSIAESSEQLRFRNKTCKITKVFYHSQFCMSDLRAQLIDQK